MSLVCFHPHEHHFSSAIHTLNLYLPCVQWWRNFSSFNNKLENANPQKTRCTPSCKQHKYERTAVYFQSWCGITVDLGFVNDSDYVQSTVTMAESPFVIHLKKKSISFVERIRIISAYTCCLWNFPDNETELFKRELKYMSR